MSTTVNIVEQLRRHRLIAILRGQYSRDQYLRIAEALNDAGIRFLEVTLNSQDPYNAIAMLRDEFPDLLVGAGTVRTVEQARLAKEHGAAYLISPGFRDAVVSYAQSEDLLHLPGVATPTEIETAVSMGCSLLKLYPASHLGGPSYLKAVAAPLDDVAFVPSGGINLDNFTAYLSAGAVAVGLGSSLLGKDTDTLTQRARQFVSALASHNAKPVSSAE